MLQSFRSIEDGQYIASLTSLLQVTHMQLLQLFFIKLAFETFHHLVTLLWLHSSCNEFVQCVPPPPLYLSWTAAPSLPSLLYNAKHCFPFGTRQRQHGCSTCTILFECSKYSSFLHGVCFYDFLVFIFCFFLVLQYFADHLLK